MPTSAPHMRQASHVLGTVSSRPPRARLIAEIWGAGGQEVCLVWAHFLIPHSGWRSLSAGVMLIRHMGSRGRSWPSNAVEGGGAAAPGFSHLCQTALGSGWPLTVLAPALPTGPFTPILLAGHPPLLAQSRTAPTRATGAAGPPQTHQPALLTLLASQCPPPLRP